MRARPRLLAIAVAIGGVAGCGPRAVDRTPRVERQPRPLAAGAPTPSGVIPARPRGSPAPAVTPAEARLGDAVAPTGYRLRLEIDPAQATFRGEATIAVAIAAPVERIWLHAAELSIDDARVEVEGAEVAAMLGVVTADERIRLELPRAVSGRARLTFTYRGAIGRGMTGLFRQTDAGAPYVYSQLEAMYARRVLPCFDEPGWKVPWDVTLVVPAGQVAVGNAPEQARATLADGRVEVRFAPTPPMASHLLALAVGPFDVVDVGPVGRAAIPARVLVPRGRGGQAAAAAAALPGVVAAIERYLDRPLPLAKLDSVVVPSFFGAMENPGLVTYAAPILLSPPDRPGALPPGFLAIAAHELAHQWFGNLVTMRWWDDLWVSESLASWLAAEVMDDVEPDRDRTAEWAGVRARAIARDLSAEAAPIRQPVRTVVDGEEVFARGVYDKGSVVLAMLAHGVGEARFVDGLRRLLDARAGGHAGVDEVAAAFGPDGADVGAALTSFLDRPGLPQVELALDCTGAPAAVAAVTRAVRVGAAPAAAGWRFPLCVRFPDSIAGAPVERCGWIDGAGGRIALATPRCPAWLAGNSGGAGYYLTAYAPALDRALRDRLADVPAVDRAALAADQQAALSAGRTTIADALAWADRLLALADPRDTVAAAGLLRAVDEQVGPAARPRWAAWLRARLGPLALAAGIAPVAGEAAPAAAARHALAELAGLVGGHAIVIGRGEVATRGWLERGGPLDDDVLLALRLAAAGHDAALVERLIARIGQERDGQTRGLLLVALASARDPRVIGRVFELIARREVSSLDAASLLANLLANPATQARAWSLLSSGTRRDLGFAPLVVPAAARLCTAAQRAQLDRAYGDVYDREGARLLASSRDAIDDCVARRAHHAASVAAAFPPPAS